MEAGRQHVDPRLGGHRLYLSLSSRSFAIVPTEQPEMETRDRDDGRTRHEGRKGNDATKCGGSERARPPERRGVFCQRAPSTVSRRNVALALGRSISILPL